MLHKHVDVVPTTDYKTASSRFASRTATLRSFEYFVIGDLTLKYDAVAYQYQFTSVLLIAYLFVIFVS